MGIGINIKKVRESRGMSRQELANRLGVTDVTISRYENEKREPKLEMLKRIAIALGVKMDTLTNEESFDFEILFAAMQVIWDYSPPDNNNDDNLALLAEHANVDYKILNDFYNHKISSVPPDCLKDLLKFISERSPNEFTELYKNSITINIHDLDEDIKIYCNQIYIKIMSNLNTNDIKPLDEFLFFLTSNGYPTIKLTNKTLEYLYGKTTQLLEFEFYKLEKNDYKLPND